MSTLVSIEFCGEQVEKGKASRRWGIWAIYDNGAERSVTEEVREFHGWSSLNRNRLQQLHREYTAQGVRVYISDRLIPA